MTRYVVTFGLLGFAGSLVVAMAAKAPTTTAVLTAFAWGVALGGLGFGIGRVAFAVIEEMNLEEAEEENLKQVELQLAAGRETVANYLQTARNIREGVLKSTSDDEDTGEPVLAQETTTSRTPSAEPIDSTDGGS